MVTRYVPRPAAGVIPVTVPGDFVLVREPGLAVWVGAVTVFPDSFAFTLLILFDTRSKPPADFALHKEQRSQGAWLEVRFSDGRSRAADLNTNTPFDQPEGPEIRLEDGEMNLTEGWSSNRWWVTPLPPSGPVELAIHLNGDEQPTGTGCLDGKALADAAACAEVLWPKQPQ